MVRYTGMKTAVREIADRWAHGSRALLAESQPYGYRLAAMLRRHENDSVARFDDPLEAALFFVLIELAKEQEAAKRERGAQSGDLIPGVGSGTDRTIAIQPEKPHPLYGT
jgi:hypothetical protein